MVDVRKRLPPGIDLLNWVRLTTESYAQLFQSSTALILHGNRHQYFINEANFSKGKFLPKNYLGTEDLGWDLFDRLFAHELEINAPVEMLTRAVEVPVKGLYIPNINAPQILVFDRDGKIIEQQVNPKKLEDLVFKRDLQSKGSLLVVPLIARDREEGRRAIAYLYSPETKHFNMPLAGSAAFLLAGAVIPALRELL